MTPFKSVDQVRAGQKVRVYNCAARNCGRDHEFTMLSPLQSYADTWVVTEHECTEANTQFGPRKSIGEGRLYLLEGELEPVKPWTPPSPETTIEQLQSKITNLEASCERLEDEHIAMQEQRDEAWEDLEAARAEIARLRSSPEAMGYAAGTDLAIEMLQRRQARLEAVIEQGRTRTLIALGLGTVLGALVAAQWLLA